jgi:hypothetical protein
MVERRQWTKTYRRDIENLSLAQDLTSLRSKVLIAIDVKWDEEDPYTILEIGLAVLDLREGKLKPNRFPPSTWSVRPHHIIIRENVGIHNSHAPSNKFGFKFGKSYFTRLERAVEYVQETLDRYYVDDVVLLGHYFSFDRTKLDDAGVDIDRDIMTFDTADLERAWSRRVNGRRKSLRRICEGLDIPYYRKDKLGNAGNDAFFSMAIFSKMCCIE